MGNGLGMEAVDVADIELRTLPLHGRGEHNLRAIGRPSRSGIGPGKTRESDDLAEIHRIHTDLRADNALVGRKAGEGDAGAVRRPAWRESN